MSVESELARQTFYITSDDQLLTTNIRVFDESEYLVTRRRNNVDTELVININYTVESSTFGLVGQMTADLEGINGDWLTGDTIIVSRAIANLQSSEFPYNGQLPSKTIEASYDKMAMRLQKLEATVERSLRLPIADDAQPPLALADRANRIVAFDESGDLYYSIYTGAPGTVTSVAVNGNDGITELVAEPNEDVLITLGLGDITPDSVISDGAISTINGAITALATGSASGVRLQTNGGIKAFGGFGGLGGFIDFAPNDVDDSDARIKSSSGKLELQVGQPATTLLELVDLNRIVRVIGDLNVTGDTDVQGDVTVTGDTDVQGDVTVDGRVGIGTSSPNALLNLYDSTNSRIRLTGLQTGASYGIDWGLNTTDGIYAAVNFDYDDRAQKGLQINSAYNITFNDIGTDGDIDAEWMRITSGGLVGIGTSAPSHKLHVAGNIGVDGNTTLGSNNSDTVDFNARIASEFTPATDNTYDLGRTGHEWRNLYLDGTANIDSLIADTADINGGTIDGTAIGATTPAAGTFSQVNSDGAIIAVGAGSFGDDTDVTGDFTVTGSVGIGLASPSQKLDVNGYAKATGLYFGGTNSLLYEAAADSVGLRVGSNGPYAEFVDAAGVLEFGNAGGSLHLTTVGTPRVYINTSGAVGVGTASPSTKLSVATATNGGISVNDGTVNGIIYGSTTLTNSFAIGTTTNHPLIFGTNNSFPQMTLATSGSVGIGTAGSPEKKLHIASNATSQTTATIPGIRIENLDTTTVNTDVSGEIEFFSKDASETDKISGFIKNVAEDAGTKYGLSFGAKTNGSNATEAMRINHAGDVGIGLTSPAAAEVGKSTLDVNGPVLARGGVSANQTSAGGLDFNNNDLRIRSWGATAGTGSMSFRTGGGGGSLDSEAMRISQGGNVGINDASPSYKLDVNGTFRSTGALWNDDSINLNRNGAGYIRHRYIDQGLFLGVTNTAGTLYYPLELNPASNFVKFSREGGVETMRIDSSGRVGIGTSSPNSKVTSMETFGDGFSASFLAKAPSGGQGRRGGYSFASTFENTGDNTARRSADIYSGFNGGAWGNEYLAFGVGKGGASNDAGGATTEQMRITGTGRLGIGASAPAAPLHVFKDAVSGATELARFQGGNGAENYRNFISLYTTNPSYWWETSLQDPSGGGTQNNLTFVENSAGTRTERMMLKSGGDVIFSGMTMPTVGVGGFAWDNANKYVRFGKMGAGVQTQAIFISATQTCGSITTNQTTTAYNTSSDYRLKENVVPMSDALQRIGNLKPSRFNFISDDSVVVDGFIAHEVQEVVPEAISGEKDAMREEEYEVTPAVLDDDGNELTPAVMGTRSVPDYQGIDQAKLTPLIVAAVQELMKFTLDENQKLAARIEALENN